MSKGLDHTVLMETLDLAVPLWIAELQAGRVSPTRSDLAVALGMLGDVLQYGSKRTGPVEVGFNALAKGLALLAMQPGGVTFRGRAWIAGATPTTGALPPFDPARWPRVPVEGLSAEVAR